MTALVILAMKEMELLVQVRLDFAITLSYVANNCMLLLFFAQILMNVRERYITVACMQGATILLEALIVPATEGMRETEYYVVSYNL